MSAENSKEKAKGRVGFNWSDHARRKWRRFLRADGTLRRFFVSITYKTCPYLVCGLEFSKLTCREGVIRRLVLLEELRCSNEEERAFPMAWREVIAWASAAVDQRVSPEVRGSKEWTLALFYRRSTLRDLKPSKPVGRMEFHTNYSGPLYVCQQVV